MIVCIREIGRLIWLEEFIRFLVVDLIKCVVVVCEICKISCVKVYNMFKFV